MIARIRKELVSKGRVWRHLFSRTRKTSCVQNSEVFYYAQLIAPVLFLGWSYAIYPVRMISSVERTFITRLSLMMNATLNLGRRYRGQVVTLMFGVFILSGAFVYSVGGSFINFTSKDFCHLAICLANCKLATVNLVKAGLTAKKSAGYAKTFNRIISLIVFLSHRGPREFHKINCPCVSVKFMLKNLR